MERPPRILDHYRHERHFLQSVNLGIGERPFLYMKNHKAACTTIIATLIKLLGRKRGAPGGTEVTEQNIHKPHKSYLLTGPRELTVAEAMEAMADRQFYKFTVVREPMDRVLSAYADKMRVGEKPRNWLMKHLKRPLDDPMTLREFLDVIVNDPVALNLDRHWRRQVDEIAYDFIAYDYVGKVRELDRVMGRVARDVFGFENVQIEDTRVTLEHRTKSGSLRDQLSNRDRQNIERVYEKDFEMYEEISQRYSG